MINEITDEMGSVDYVWTHALISDESYKGIYKYCDLESGKFSDKCEDYLDMAWTEMGDIDYYNIYAPLCWDVQIYTAQDNNSIGSVSFINYLICYAHIHFT